jgi:hypothetical protein
MLWMNAGIMSLAVSLDYVPALLYAASSITLAHCRRYTQNLYMWDELSLLK